LKKRYPAVEVELIRSAGGVFEVTAEGRLVYSKKQTGRFPQNYEIFGKLDDK